MLMPPLTHFCLRYTNGDVTLPLNITARRYAAS